MIELIIKPLESALGVNLNSPRIEVHNLIGNPTTVIDNTDHYQDENLMFSVDYDENNCVEYISISKPNSKMYKVLYNNYNIFEIAAEELIEKIENESVFRFDRNDPEIEYSYIFNDLELSFWRPTIPERKEDNDGRYFETVGIGVKGYYD